MVVYDITNKKSFEESFDYLQLNHVYTSKVSMYLRFALCTIFSIKLCNYNNRTLTVLLPTIAQQK